jgi:hypothetical protein
VDYRRDDQVASQLDPVDGLRYRNNFPDTDRSITRIGGGKFSKTTGQIISVDGGLHEVFLR